MVSDGAPACIFFSRFIAHRVDRVLADSVKITADHTVCYTVSHSCTFGHKFGEMFLTEEISRCIAVTVLRLTVFQPHIPRTDRASAPGANRRSSMSVLCDVVGRRAQSTENHCRPACLRSKSRDLWSGDVTSLACSRR